MKNSIKTKLLIASLLISNLVALPLYPVNAEEMPPVKVKTKVYVKDHQVVEVELLQHEKGLGDKAEASSKM